MLFDTELLYLVHSDTLLPIGHVYVSIYWTHILICFFCRSLYNKDYSLILKNVIILLNKGSKEICFGGRGLYCKQLSDCCCN